MSSFTTLNILCKKRAKSVIFNWMHAFILELVTKETYLLIDN